MKYVILTGGAPPTKKLLTEHLSDADKLIGVDGAADVLVQYDTIPDVLIGDFDTADEQCVSLLQERGAQCAGENHKGHRRPDTDDSADANEEIELEQRDQREKKKQPEEHSNPQPSGSVVESLVSGMRIGIPTLSPTCTTNAQ